MRVFTKRLWQFAGCALAVSIAFHCVLNFCMGSYVLGCVLLSVAYFCMMYFMGWYFGRKDNLENNIYDIGIRWHVVTFLICNGLSYLFWYLFFCESRNGVSRDVAGSVLEGINWSVLVWSMFLAVHFLAFLFTRKNAIKGYSKDEIFE